MGVLQLLQQVYGQITYAIALALQIVTQLITSGWYIVVRDAAQLTTDIHSLLEDPDCGQVAQCNKLDTVLTDLATLASDISALGNPQQTASPVTLPAVPPAGYGAPSSSSNAAAVWAFASTDQAIQMGVVMSALSTFIRFQTDSFAWPIRIGDHFYVNLDLYALINNPNTGFNSHSAGEILTTDSSVLDFLQRIEPTWTWNQLGDGTYWASLPGTSSHAIMFCTLTPQEFLWFRAAASGTLPGPLVPPIWPGIANVTLGAPVPFSGSTLSVAGPMDGVIVTITSVNQPLPHYNYGTAAAWGKLGGLTFVDDNGEAEEYQLFGFVDAIYVPRAMVQAASCQVRNTSGIVGTVTPWTKS